jgi:outer membrane receptor protein involved in Fe transport
MPRARTFAQDSTREQGVTRSGIDLRGLGRRRTLVLVDGRRMPSTSFLSDDFDQPDVNGVPVSAIERIETLTGTSGGIHGPSALGGVINVVLRRDYRGAAVNLTSGFTSRGDAQYWRVEGRLGFTPDGGRTDVMLLASHHISEPLLAGDRDYHERARRRQFENDPATFLDRRNNGTNLPVGNSVSVFSQSGNPLVLDPQFGGRSIGASFTYLPLGFAGTRSEAVDLLRQNAGTLNLELAFDRSGRLLSVSSNPVVTSGLLNIRHRFSDRIEAFVDGLIYTNKGSYQSRTGAGQFAALANSPNNPFTEAVYFRYPLPGARSRRRSTDTARLSAGMIAKLPLHWSATADYSIGFSRQTEEDSSVTGGNPYDFAVRSGVPDPGGLPAVDPLGNWSDVVASSLLYLRPQATRIGPIRNRFRDANLRVAGPVLSSGAGVTTLTLLAQRRTEHVPSIAIAGGLFVYPGLREAVSSGYAELRAPLTGEDSRLLRRLELQAAARYDHAWTIFSGYTGPGGSGGPLTRVKRDGFNYTLGARVHPLPNVMLRASIATGELYPTPEQLKPLVQPILFAPLLNYTDPRRGGEFIGGNRPAILARGGSATNGSELATTVSAGLVLNRSGERGPRVSIDYSRIDIRRQILAFPATLRELLAREDAFPGRVSRGPLSEEDARRGFTGGPVTGVDLSAVNQGRTIADSIDVEADWPVPFRSASELRLYGSATAHLRHKMLFWPTEPWVEHVGRFDGPLAWRGNVGAEWTHGPLSIDINVQMFAGYRLTYASPQTSGVAVDNVQALRFQGTGHIPSQAYMDLAVRRRFRLGGRFPALGAIDLRFGIQNVFDERPPLIANRLEVPYSTYGDARRRRFELAVSSGF